MVRHLATLDSRAQNFYTDNGSEGYHRESSVPSSHASVTQTNGIEAGAGYGGASNPSHDRDRKPDARLDGMSALLKAGEMVDRRAG